MKKPKIETRTVKHKKDIKDLFDDGYYVSERRSFDSYAYKEGNEYLFARKQEPSVTYNLFQYLDWDASIYNWKQKKVYVIKKPAEKQSVKVNDTYKMFFNIFTSEFEVGCQNISKKEALGIFKFLGEYLDYDVEK